MSILQITDSEVMKKKLLSCDFSFITTISFEKRNRAIINELTEMNVSPKRALVFDYNTIAEPPDQDNDSREKNRQEIFGMLNKKSCLVEHKSNFNAFAIMKSQKEIERFLLPSETLLIDITCMTRVNIFAIASLISKIKELEIELYIIYTSPRTYGFEHGKQLGWKDVIFIPIGRTLDFKREGHARGIILVGHDRERLSLAMQEVEPSEGGILIYTATKSRPDFMVAAREANQIISDRMLKLKSQNDPTIYAWLEKKVFIDETEKIINYIEHELDKATDLDGPLILYPFGPKILSLQAAITLAIQNKVTSWAVYPIASRFDADSTNEIGNIHYFKLCDR